MDTKSFEFEIELGLCYFEWGFIENIKAGCFFPTVHQNIKLYNIMQRNDVLENTSQMSEGCVILGTFQWSSISKVFRQSLKTLQCNALPIVDFDELNFFL